MRISEYRLDRDSNGNTSATCASQSNPIGVQSGGAPNHCTQIHKMPDVDPPCVDLHAEYELEKTIAEGCFARIFLATHRATRTQVVLKAIHAEMTSLKDFIKEYHYNYTLSHHPNILSSYRVCFKADNFYCFAQEHACYGDLAGNVKAGGLSEESCKRIASQISGALDFMHSKQLVHRDLKLENILVFSPDFARVKLCDFGATVREGTLVNRNRTWASFLPPEVCEIVKNERYICKSSSDVWQLAVVLFVCLTGNPPWQHADSIRDGNYSSFFRYQRRRTTKIPNNFRRFSPRLLRMFRKMFEHKPDKRAKVTEVSKYMKDSWLDTKIVHSSSGSNIFNYTPLRGKESVVDLGEEKPASKNSIDENKNKLAKLLSSYGLETTVDQQVTTKRIWEWVLSCDNQDGQDVELY